MKRIILLIAVLLLVFESAPAQHVATVQAVLQTVIDSPPMEQAYEDLIIRGELCVVRTPALPKDLRLTKFGRALPVEPKEEDAYFRCESYVMFSEVSVSPSAEATIEAFVTGPLRESAGDGIVLTSSLRRESRDWAVVEFQRFQ